jgi:DMSO/TMAO reductase YedYZ molybdopterin-dependent catalytic subunit
MKQVLHCGIMLIGGKDGPSSSLGKRERGGTKMTQFATSQEEFTREEVMFALRNAGMPLEGLRYPITPIGMHFHLIHFDIPSIDPTSYELPIEGRVRRPLRLTLDDIKARPAVTMPVMMECAGIGRAHLSPRPLSAPWHDEAIGCAQWKGTPLAPILKEAGLLDDAVEILFSDHDRGIDHDVEHDYERSLPLEEAVREDVLLAYEMNGQPLPPQHGFPLRLIVPEWYGMTSVKWLKAITAISEALRRCPAGDHLPLPQVRGRSWQAGEPQIPTRSDGAPRHPRWQPDPYEAHPCRRSDSGRPRMVWLRSRRAGGVLRRRRKVLEGC